MYMKKRMILTVLSCLVLAGCNAAPASQTATEPSYAATAPSQTVPMTQPPETFPEIPVETTVSTEPDAPIDGGVDMVFTPVDEKVTAKIEVNLRSVPSQGEDSAVVYTLQNGETVQRTGISASGWSEITWKGKTCYAVSSYLTTDLDYKPPVQIQTPFTPVNEQVTPKDAVNLRTLPSTTHPEVEVVVKLEKGQVVTRTGINEDVGWSRVEWEGQTLYCISSYLRLAEEPVE